MKAIEYVKMSLEMSNGWIMGLAADAKDIAITLAQHPNSALLTITPTNLPGAIAMPADASSYAKRLYAALREADAMGADLIIVERPTAIGPIWDAVRDRLRRASAEH